MVDPVTAGIVLTVLSGLTSGFTKYKEAQRSAKADRYRASLADENAKRADILHLEREERARREGLLDAGLFRMRAEMSGLSGVSADLWIGQRYMDVYKDITRERVSRSQAVNRFLKEAQWHRSNVSASESSALWSAIGTGLSTAAGVVNLYNNRPQPQVGQPQGK